MQKYILGMTFLILLLSTSVVWTANQKFPVNIMKNVNLVTLPQTEFLSSEYPNVVVLFRSWCPASRLQIEELQELLGRLKKQDEPFHLVLIGLDRKYGYASESNYTVHESAILEYAKTKNLDSHFVFLGDQNIQDLKALNTINKIDVTPIILFVTKQREVYTTRKGFHKALVLHEILNRMK